MLFINAATNPTIIQGQIVLILAAEPAMMTKPLRLAISTARKPNLLFEVNKVIAKVIATELIIEK